MLSNQGGVAWDSNVHFLPNNDYQMNETLYFHINDGLGYWINQYIGTCGKYSMY